MAKDTRAWITIADEFPEHPKTLNLSDAAFRAVVELWCYSNRRRTDGRIPPGLIRRYGKSVEGELTDEGFMVKAGDGYQMHDYLKHQKSKAEIEAYMADKKANGRRGGIASAHTRLHVKKNVIDPACELCPPPESDPADSS